MKWHDTRESIKQLNDLLVELGEQVMMNQAKASDVEELLNDTEFARLMNNVRFFQKDGNKFLADIYTARARVYAEEANK
jgi:hypothetical protein